MNRPLRLLDLFCGAGGCSVGYHRAGFTEIIGVDNVPMPRYPFTFVQSDALEYLTTVKPGDFDLIHASPPCQKYFHQKNGFAAERAALHPDLVGPVRAELKRIGTPWVMENIPGAPLISPVTICGLALNLKVKRHRLFESSEPIFGTECPSHNQDYYVIFGHEVRNRRHGQAAGRKNNIAVGREAMGIPWMTRGELSQAIPPAYTEWIGKQIAAVLRPIAAAAALALAALTILAPAQAAPRRMLMTAYHLNCRKCHTGPRTATGARYSGGVATNAYPLHARLRIRGLGTFTNYDRMKRVPGPARIDRCVRSHREAVNCGRRWVWVTRVRKGGRRG